MEVRMVTAAPSGRNRSVTGPVEAWPDVAWRRLLDAVADPALVWRRVSRCDSCGQPLAAADCEPDRALCWSGVRGSCL